MRSVLNRRASIVPVAVSIVIAALIAGCGSSTSSGGSNSSTKTGASNSSGGGYGGGYGGYGSSSSSSSSQTSSGGGTLKLASTSMGKILVNSGGFTLYEFTADGQNSDHCVKVSGCVTSWPPLTVSGKPTAGSGVTKSLLGTIKLADGHQQVTYAGHPLYRYSGDASPGSTSYIGVTSFGGTWLAVNAAGKPVH